MSHPFDIKVGLSRMLRRGVIMDVTNIEQAQIAEEAGAIAVMALEKIPADIRAEGGIARMANPSLIREIQAAVSIPVMAKCRIGHFVEAQILQELGVDFIDESEVLTPADPTYHIDKQNFKIPFVCGARNLDEALHRIQEGAALIRTKGEAGTGNIIEAVFHMRETQKGIKILQTLSPEELYHEAKRLGTSVDVLHRIAQEQRLPVPLFAAGGIATVADCALLMQLGAESVFVGSGIFKSEDPSALAKAIVQAATYFDDPSILAEITYPLKGAMKGIQSALADLSRGQ